VTSDRTISILFMIGSACFAVGAVPGYAGAVGVTADGVTFFVGSLFFTAAAYGQFLQSWRTSARRWRDNMCGSVAFGAAAVASYVVPDSGALRNAMVVNLGTCLGALCFLAGAYPLLPRSPAKRTLTVGGTPA
jgi:hypothetical protein